MLVRIQILYNYTHREGAGNNLTETTLGLYAFCLWFGCWS